MSDTEAAETTTSFVLDAPPGEVSIIQSYHIPAGSEDGTDVGENSFKTCLQVRIVASNREGSRGIGV